MIKEITILDWVKATKTQKIESAAVRLTQRLCKLQKTSTVFGYYSGDLLIGCIVGQEISLTIFEPKEIYVFEKYRNTNVGKNLVDFLSSYIFNRGYKYLQGYSTKTALPFYQSLGLKFWGKNERGHYFTLHKIVSNKISEGVYDYSDPIIKEEVDKIVDSPVLL